MLLESGHIKVLDFGLAKRVPDGFGFERDDVCEA